MNSMDRKKTQHQKSLRVRFINWMLIFLCCLLFINVVRSVFLLYRKTDVVSEAENQRNQAKQEHEELLRKYAQAQNRVFVEKEAREKLNIGREGDVIVLLPTLVPSSVTATVNDTTSNWNKWLAVFM